MRNFNSVNGTSLNANGVNGFADWGSSLFSAAGDIFSSIKNSKTAEENNESQERQLELQLQAQRELTAAQAAQSGQTVKIVMISAAALIAVGTFAFVILKPSKRQKSKQSF